MTKPTPKGQHNMSRTHKTSPAQMRLLELPEQVYRAKLPKLEEPCAYGQAYQDETSCAGKPNHSRRAWTGPDPGMLCCEFHWLEIIDDMLHQNASRFHKQGTSK